MRVGIIGTGAIAVKHAQAYRNIGFPIVACANNGRLRGEEFAISTGAEFVGSNEELCRRPDVDYVDLCTLPSVRMEVLGLCARYSKPLLVQKPMSVDLQTARAMVTQAEKAHIPLGVVSQHRFDDSVLFLKQALTDGRLGRVLQADAYVKWHRSDEYYSRPIKGSWAGEGGGALINQAIHQVDLLLHLVGPVARVFGEWKLGATHSIESEDMLVGTFRYANGAIGVMEASTSLWPGYPERLELHGTKGTAIITGDKLTTWDVENDVGDPPPLMSKASSGASDPMAISIVPFERQFQDFAQACSEGREPMCSGMDGFRALQVVTGLYDSCRKEQPVTIRAEF